MKTIPKPQDIYGSGKIEKVKENDGAKDKEPHVVNR